MLLALAWSADSAEAQVIRVNAGVVGGLGDGSSWADAVPDLNTALATAAVSPYLQPDGRNNAEIWVAAGDYYPSHQQLVSPATNPEGLTFLVPHGVAVIGAFPNTGSPGLSDIDYGLVRHTILHGDWMQGSQVVKANNVVVCDPGLSSSDLAKKDQTKIHNVTIQYGRAAGLPSNDGGGIYSFPQAGEPKIGLDIRNCIFIGNVASNEGGAVYFNGTNDLVWLGIYRSQFVNNLAVNRGGAVYMNNIGSTATEDYSEPSWVYNCLFRGNFAGFSTDPAVTIDNGGGGIYLKNHDNLPSFANNLFYGNFVRGWGSAMAVRPTFASGEITFSNNTVTQNVGIVGPGGIPTGTTVPATTPGGALTFDSPTSAGGNVFQVNNNIIWKNENVGATAEIVGTALAAGTVNVRYSDVYMDYSTQVWPGTGNINAVPHFVDSIAGNFYVETGPTIDTGSDSYLPDDLPIYGGVLQGGTLPVIDYDHLGDPLIHLRSFDVLTVTNAPGLTDMGCYEFNE